jgi:hypothetical protein
MLAAGIASFNNRRCDEDIEEYYHMEKNADRRPTAELSPGMIKTICDAISQGIYSWELKEENDGNKVV